MIHITNKSVFVFEGKCLIVNTVNTEKVMGKGLALEFKIRFPKYFDHYVGCASIKIGGDVDVYNNVIASFATKESWKSPSKIQWIEKGLINLKSQMQLLKLNEVALPLLGSGNGGLNFEKEVLPLIEKILDDANLVIHICLSKEDSQWEKEIVDKFNRWISISSPELLNYFNKRQFESFGDFVDSGGRIVLIRDFLKIKGVGEETYRKILDSRNQNSISLFD